ncbi:MAG: sensor histidine kinase [Vicinamibacterales bacterium]
MIAGFGITLGLWLLVGYHVTAQLATAERDAASLSQRYVQAQERLSSVRAQVLVASVLVRDAVLDTTPRPATDYQREVEAAYRAIDHELSSYVPVLDSAAEGGRVQGLREDIDAFRRASLDTLAVDRRTWPGGARTLLQRSQPKREAVIAVSEEIQAINRLTYVAQQEATAVAQRGLQRQVWTVLGVALALSVFIGWLALRHATRLEHRLLAQSHREAQISADLHRLSARLVGAQEEERRRIARELHDDVGQALSAVNVELAVAERRSQRAGVTSDALGAARALVDGALRRTRDVSQLLHPSALDDLGLAAALASVLSGFERRHHLPVDFRNESGPNRFEPEIERAVFRLVQEALTNIARHAHASRVTVSLERADDALRVCVADDGVGFDADSPGQGTSRGLGLVGMRERVSHLGGTLVVTGRPGAGTRIEVRIPIRPEPGAGNDAPLEAHEVAHG